MATLDTFVADLRGIFALRLSSVVLYGRHAVSPPSPGVPAHTLVVVTTLGFGDLEACARRAAAWRKDGLAVPLLLDAGDLARSLDAFPAEFSAMLSAYRVVFGPDPFEGLAVDPKDLRRACEVEARGHLLHLREGFVEGGGTPDAIASLVAASAPALRALLVNLARLDGSVEAAPSAYVTGRLGPVHGRTLATVLTFVDSPIASADAARGFPAYVDAAEALVAYVDRWRA